MGNAKLRNASVEYNIWRANSPKRKSDFVLSGYWDKEFDKINNKIL